MEKIGLSKLEIRHKLADNPYWCEGKLHVSIHRLYLDVVCPKDCPSNKINSMGFCYCEEGCPYGTVCYSYKDAMKEFGTESMI